MRAIPEPVAAQAEAVRRSAAAAPDRGAARPDPETTTALVGARAQGRRVRFGYCSEAGPERIFEVDAWAVVVRHGRSYLRLVGTTSDPIWYAEQLAVVPRIKRVVGGPEAVFELGLALVLDGLARRLPASHAVGRADAEQGEAAT